MLCIFAASRNLAVFLCKHQAYSQQTSLRDSAGLKASYGEG